MSTILTKRRKAVTPLIASVILIAVAPGIAAAFWASGLTSSFYKCEKLGVSTQYAVSAGARAWVVTLGSQNTGSPDAAITTI